MSQDPKCAEFDRLQAVSDEAAKRIREYLHVKYAPLSSPLHKQTAARNDLADIAEKIERGEWP